MSDADAPIDPEGDPRLPANWIDRVSDRAARTADRAVLQIELRDRAGLADRARLHRRPVHRLRHAYAVVEFLSQQLALAEFCLLRGFSYAEYRRLSRALDLG